jgi:hypothetical protein
MPEPVQIITCQGCGKKYRWKPDLAGKSARCQCGKTIRIPASNEAASDAPPPPPKAAVTPRPTAPPLPARVRNPPIPPVTAPVPPPLPSPAVAPALAYATRELNVGRPGILTALAIAALIIGLGSVATNVTMGMKWFRFAARSTPPPGPALPAALPAANIAPYTGDVVRPRGLFRAARQELVKSIPITGPFAADRSKMVERLLAEVGLDVVADAAPSSVIFKSLSPDATAGAPDVLSAPGGTVTVTNSTASFVPKGRQGSSPSATVDWNIVTTDSGSQWSAATLEERIHTAQASLPGVTPLQLGALVKRIGLTAMPPPPPPNVINYHKGIEEPFYNCTMSSEGVLTAYVGNASWSILPDGRSIATAAAAFGLDVAHAAPRPAPARPFIPYLPGSTLGMRALGWHSVASGVLALALIIFAIAILRNSRPGWDWLRRWAGMKFLMVVAEILLSLWFIQSASAFVPSNQAPWIGQRRSIIAYNTSSALMGVATTAVAQCILPAIALGILLGAESVAWRFGSTQGSGSSNKHPSRVGLILVWVGTVAVGLAALANVGTGVTLGISQVPNLVASAAHIVVGGILLVGCLIAVRKVLARTAGGGS